jgi:transposase
VQGDCITVALRLPEVRVIRQEETEAEIMVEVAYRASRSPCPRCGRDAAKVHSTKAQRKRDLRLWGKPVLLVLHKRRFRCVGCGKVFTEADPVCGTRRRSTQRFRCDLGQKALLRPVRHVAAEERVGEALVRRCATEEAARLLGVEDQSAGARVLGLDEFAIRKGQIYDTAIMDIERRVVLGVVSGHRQAEVAAFFDCLANSEAVEVVVMDMHEPFRQAAQLCLPRAKVVADKFHVLAHVHRALDQVRTSLEPVGRRRGELFRARYLLLTALERLTPERYHRLMELLRRYPVLEQAWALKETFRAWYCFPTQAAADAGLAAWEDQVREQGPAPFRRLLPMLRTWRREILNYFECPYTNGFVEGKNNRIKVIKRVAYGYRNTNNFRERILLSNRRQACLKAA